MTEKINPPYIGASYYPEVWPESCVDEDIAKMKELGINCVRMAEFAWSSIEPIEGTFYFDFFIRVMDKLYDAGIAVVLGTPSAAPPKWLTDKYPETLIEKENGIKAQFGGRCHVCKTSHIMREKNRIIITKMCEAFKGHKAIIGWQIDNEIFARGDGCFCPQCREKFQKWLQKKYKTIKNLNEKWGTERWSLKYSGFNDVIAPRSDTLNHPSLRAEWLHFHSDNIVEYVNEQAVVIKTYFDVPVGTDMMSTQIQDYKSTTKALDIIQYNHYEAADKMRDPLFWYDFLRPIKPIPFWVTETQAGWNGAQFAINGRREKGNCYINSWLPFIKGGEMNLYWPWRAHSGGFELAHGAILSSAGRYNYMVDEIKSVSNEIDKCKEILNNTKIYSEIAIHFSAVSWLDFKCAPLVENFNYQAAITSIRNDLSGYNVDVIDTDAEINKYKIIISPFLVNLEENKLFIRMKKWVEKGGVWIVGPMSDIMTDYVVKYTDAPYKYLEGFAGVFTKFQMPVDSDRVRAAWKDGSKMEISLTYDGYELDGAVSLADYTFGHPKGLAAVTEKKVGKGKVILLGTKIGRNDLLRLIDLPPIATASDNLNLTIRTAITEEYLFVAEIDNKMGTIELNKKYFDVLSEQYYSGKVSVKPYQLLVLKKLN